MARVKRAVHAKKHHRAILEQAQGYYGNKSRSFRAANEQVMHSLQYAYRRFIAGLKSAGVEVDRKMLADLAVRDAAAFAALVTVAGKALDGEGPSDTAADAGAAAS